MRRGIAKRVLTRHLILLATLVSYSQAQLTGAAYPCKERYRNVNLPCQCVDDEENGTAVNCDNVAFFGDFPLLPFQQRVFKFSQRNAGVQNLEAQLFTASQVPLRNVDFSDNLLRRLTDRVFDGIEGTVEEINLANNQLGDQLNPIFSTAEFQKLSRLRRLDLSVNGLRALDSNIFEGLRHLTDLNLRGNELDHVPSDGLRKLPSLQSLHLQDNQISHLAVTHFPDHPNLVFLNLSSNSIEVVGDNAFDGLPSLQRLILSRNRVSQVNQAAFQGSVHLQELDLSNNFLTQVPVMALERLEVLRKLNLNSNKIRSLEGASFSIIINLEELDLSRNGISKIPSSTFLGARTIKELRLDYNNLRKLNPDSFYSLENLEAISLADNQILAFPSDVFDQLKKLLKVNMDYNRIAAISSTILESIQQVEELSLSFNLIRDIPDGCFQNFKKLALLNLYGNKIKEISVSKLSGIEGSILVLDLGNNNLKELPRLSFPQLQIASFAANEIPDLTGYVFELMPELRYLNLSHNQIAEIEAGTFDSLQRLKVLDLSGNKIEAIRANTFSNFSLDTIYLQNNLLNELGPRSFFKMASLEKLDLSGNKLTTIKNAAFDQLPNLKSLWLNNNMLSSIKGDMFSAKTSLESLDLSNNHITYLYPNSFTVHPSLSKISLASNKLTFFPSEIIRGVSSLQTIDLRKNRLQSLEDADFANMPTLRELYLQDNMIGKIGDSTFQNSTQLHYVDLSNNNVSALQEKTFHGVSRLTLDLSRNNLSSLPGDIFSRIHVFKLEGINMADNEFREFPTAALKKQFSFLERVDLSNNKIRDLPSNADALVNVKQLDLSNNPLSYEAHLVLLSEPKSIRRLNIARTGLQFLPLIESPFLKELNVSKNEIATVEKDAFQKTGYIKTLDLSDNKIKSVKFNQPQPWLQLPLLRHLDISGNPLTSILGGDFDLVPNLESLNIANLPDLSRLDCEAIFSLKKLNRLIFHSYDNLNYLDTKDCLQHAKSLEALETEIRDPQLTDQLQDIYSPRLKKLSLTGRTLRSLSSGAFAGLQNSDLSIDLKNTSISILPMTVFLPLPLSSKIKLNVSGSEITNINPQLLQTLNSKQSSIKVNGFEDNPISCDCNLQPFWTWLQEKLSLNPNRENSEGIYAVSCHYPPHLKGKKVLSLTQSELVCDERAYTSTTTYVPTTTRRRPPSTREEPDIIFEAPSTSPRPIKKAIPASAVNGKSTLTKVDTMIIGIVAGVVAFVCILIIIICVIRLRRARPHYTAGPLAGPLALRAQGTCTCLKPPNHPCSCYPPSNQNFHPQAFSYSTMGRQKIMPPHLAYRTMGRPHHLKNTPYYVTYPDSDENR